MWEVDVKLNVERHLGNVAEECWGKFGSDPSAPLLQLGLLRGFPSAGRVRPGQQVRAQGRPFPAGTFRMTIP